MTADHSRPTGATPPIEVARTRRHDMRTAMVALEGVMASPASAPNWKTRSADALDELKASFEEHIATTEGAGGLLDEILAAAPRLGHEIDVIKSEHGELDGTFGTADDLVRSGGDPEAIRERVVQLLGLLSAHRQRGADLVYDAYNVDIAAAG